MQSFRSQFPPQPEQRAIAEALSDVDGLMGALDQLIAKKRDLKQAAMQQLLTGKKRLPGFNGEWEVKAGGSSILRRNDMRSKRIKVMIQTGDIQSVKVLHHR